MSEITITGNPKQIYNIVKEQRIRIKRGMVEITGDIGNPVPKPEEVKITMVALKTKKKESKKKYKTKEEKKTPDNK